MDELDSTHPAKRIKKKKHGRVIAYVREKWFIITKYNLDAFKTSRNSVQIETSVGIYPVHVEC
jgi:hypothetical protein